MSSTHQAMNDHGKQSQGGAPLASALHPLAKLSRQLE